MYGEFPHDMQTFINEIIRLVRMPGAIRLVIMYVRFLHENVLIPPVLKKPLAQTIYNAKRLATAALRHEAIVHPPATTFEGMSCLTAFLTEGDAQHIQSDDVSHS